jgi:Predicted transcriptional regulators
MPRPPLALHIRLGRAVRRLRSDAGYSQERFAGVAGVHRTSMSAIERGEFDIALSTLEQLAKGLGMLPSALLAEAEREGKRPVKSTTGEARVSEP